MWCKKNDDPEYTLQQLHKLFLQIVKFFSPRSLYSIVLIEEEAIKL